MEDAYLSLLRQLLAQGTPKADRTGTGTLSTFGVQLRHELASGFPLLTTKRVFFKGVAVELLWFLRGETNVAFLHEHGVTIWDEWANPDGELGPVYGKQWRAWPTPDGQTIDQLANVVRDLRHNPDSRRILVSAWNVADLGAMALQPCHVLFQFYSQPREGARRRLSCQVYQRSADVFLGVPFNIASYALLTHMVAQVTDHDPGELVWVGGDVHLYQNHTEQAREQLQRAPRSLPKLALNPAIQDLDGFSWGDCKLEGYDPHPAIKAAVAV